MISQESAKEYFDYGALVIFLNAPEKMEFGIDNHNWIIGDKFKGIKMIPPGFHLITFTAHNVQRMGTCKFLKSKEIIVLKWNSVDEDIAIIDANLGPEQSEEIERYRHNITEFEPFMAPYPFDEGEDYERWMSLCYAITPKDVELFLPKRDHVFTSMSCSNLESEDVAPLRFSNFDLKRSFPPNAVGEERSKYSRDKTYLLKSVLKSLGYDCQRLIAEFQFAFIALVFMQNFDGFEQWKRILHLVCHSGEFVSENQQFYVEFINALEFQLLNVPEEFFDAEILTESNFMDDALEELFREVIIDNCCEGPGLLLVDRLTRFNEFISSRFKRNILEAARKEES